jgi:ubiquinone/menaquinone biosynthesis C-methylase UbiE
MISNMKTKKFTEVGKEYDRAYRTGSPFCNPRWFVKKIKSVVDAKAPGRVILDVGCGDGHFLAGFSGYKRYGVDLSKEAIKKASASVDGVFRVSPGEKLPFRKDLFDAVICMGSMEHFIDMDAALREMKRVAKKGSVIVIHVPNSRYLVNSLLGVKTHHQINERFATESEWKEIISQFFAVEKTLKYNTRWFLKILPTAYSCHFTFVCRNG